MNHFHTMPAAVLLRRSVPTAFALISTAHTLIERSAQHAYRQHPKLGGIGKATTKAMDIGTVIHSLILEGEGGCESVEVLGFDNYKTKAAQTERDAAELAGKIPILIADWRNCKAIATARRGPAIENRNHSSRSE